MTDDDLHALLAQHESAGAPVFAPGFVDRVMDRVARRGVPSFDLALERQARRILPALAAASLLLGVWNWWTARDGAPSTVGAVLGVARNASGAGYASTPLGLTNTEAFE